MKVVGYKQAVAKNPWLTVEEYAAQFGFGAEQIAMLKQAITAMAANHVEDAGGLRSCIQDEEDEDDYSDRDRLWWSLDRLGELEPAMQKVVAMRLGLEGEEPMTWQQIADRFDGRWSKWGIADKYKTAITKIQEQIGRPEKMKGRMVLGEKNGRSKMTKRKV